MKAGREIDALVAERIFDWQWVTGILPWNFPCLISPEHHKETGFDIKPTDLRRPRGTFPHYSTEIADAWRILEAIQKTQSPVEIKGDAWHDGEAWRINVYDIIGEKILYSATDRIDYSTGEKLNPSLAICKVGLLFYSRWDEDY